MRWLMLGLLFCTVTGAAVTGAALGQGQNPPVPPAQAQSDPRLDALLAHWEKAMTGVQSLHAKCVRTKLNKTFDTTEVFEGSAKYLRAAPGQTSRASLELFKRGRPEIFEKYLCSGNFLYQWSPADKTIRVHELPPPKPGQIADDNFLSFLFGMKAVEAKARYHMTYVPPPANDKWYYYMEIQPRHAVDKADFTKARLVLLQSNYLPRQLWFLEAQGDEVTWDFPEVVSPAKLLPVDFAHPQLPQGWQFQKVPLQAQPRVLRNNTP
jgi:TIGR03009 family protein